MDIGELYEILESIGCLTFSTLAKNGEIHSRISHFNGYDEDGLYFRTMTTKPYFRQLISTGNLTVCGLSDSRVLGGEDDDLTLFPPSIYVRLIGRVKLVEDDVMIKKSLNNNTMKNVSESMEQYKNMKGANFVLYSAKVDIYDSDFELMVRDYKLERKRFSFGGYKFNEIGPKINDKCVGCGECKKACTFKSIDEIGQVYKVNPNRCDDCGDCILVCKYDAIDGSLEF